jgi:hypothetical protein
MDTTPPETAEPTSSSPDDEKQVKSLPILEGYMKGYARSCGNNDQKAAKLFTEYEPGDKVNRLKREVAQVVQGIVAEPTLVRVIGNARKAKYGGFEKWARMMTGFLNKKS